MESLIKLKRTVLNHEVLIERHGFVSFDQL